MENKFSFPIIPPPDSDQFEFGPMTLPGSPTSPADHLFSNGKLLPHVFPTPTNYSRSTSRTSSSSRDYSSLMSSRSNSTNSRSSNCSSARTSTSTSEAAERRSSVQYSPRKEIGRNNNRGMMSSSQYQHGASSQRWQLIAGAPVLMHQGSRSRSKVDRHVAFERNGSKKSRKVDGGAKSWFGNRILKSLVSACKECHAIKA